MSRKATAIAAMMISQWTSENGIQGSIRHRRSARSPRIQHIPPLDKRT
jgi:hypothetical protein